MHHARRRYKAQGLVPADYHNGERVVLPPSHKDALQAFIEGEVNILWQTGKALRGVDLPGVVLVVDANTPRCIRSLVQGMCRLTYARGIALQGMPASYVFLHDTTESKLLLDDAFKSALPAHMQQACTDWLQVTAFAETQADCLVLVFTNCRNITSVPAVTATTTACSATSTGATTWRGRRDADVTVDTSTSTTPLHASRFVAP